MNKNKIYNYIDDNLDTHIQNIQSWVKQKSVSWDNLGMDDASKMVFESFKKLGCKEVEYIDGKYYPGIYAYYDAGSKYTLHNYCMYWLLTWNESTSKYSPSSPLMQYFCL